MRTRFLVIAGTLLALIILAVVFFPRVTYVDLRPAVTFGNEYFSKLQQGRLDDAFAMYTDGFVQKRGREWRTLLTDFATQQGAVTAFSVATSSLAPVTLNDSTDIPCVLIRYKVMRSSFESAEMLTVCPGQHGAEYGIAGHEITRLDTKQHFAAGLTIQEKTIISTP
jgi:hypothetical protein